MRIGSKENPYRILVADNWGMPADPILEKAYPNITFSVWGEENTESNHPHGHMVAECLVSMLSKYIHAEVVFYPFLLKQQEDPDGWLNVLFEARKEGNPFHFCNCSFGAHHRDMDYLRDMLKKEWSDPAKLQTAREKIGDTIVVFASGNQDSTNRFKVDTDNDVNYPQRPLSELENVFVIGACDFRGIPSSFSSDGLEVSSMYWGEGVPVWDPVDEEWTYINGTSFASPFACGDMVTYSFAKESFSPDKWTQYVLDNAWVALGWERGDIHPKAGLGCMLPSMLENLDRNSPQGKHLREARDIYSLPLSLKVTYLDFDPI